MARNRVKKTDREEKEGKKAKRKPKYSTVFCIRWLVKRMWQWDRSLILSSAAMIPFSVILYAVGLYMPPIILDSLQTEENFNVIALVIAALLGAELFFTLIKDFFSHMRDNARYRNANRFYWELARAFAQKDYYLNYDKQYLTVKDRAYNVLGRQADGSPGRFVIQFSDVVINVLCFLLFGSVVSALSPWILLLLVAGSLITLIPRRYQQDKDHEERDERNANSKKLSYLSWRLSNKLEAGKDIRIYGLTEFLEEKVGELIGEHIRLLRRQQRRRSLSVYVNLGVGFLRDGLAYLFLIQGVFQGSVSPGEFVLYFNAISKLFGFVNGIVRYIGSAHEAVLGISDCIVYFDEERGRMNRGEGLPLPKGRPLSVEFRHVTYKYPEGKENVLEDISFQIAAGEKISLVGLNGAGKTTLTKLMCGLLLPDEGEVLIDGHGLLEYNRDELYTLFSIVTQNYTVLPTTVAENVAFCDRSRIDEKRLWSCLEKAGIADKIRSLPKGIDSEMDKQYDADAVSFSGGEMQKLLLARAIYREASVFILDEPTSALDPIAEDNMYHSYRDLTNGATSVFVSHRLASTRFCDCIYLLDGARLAECGTHEELMALGGRYRELFDIQSRYYKEGGDCNEVTE